MRRLALALFLLTACGDDDDGGPDGPQSCRDIADAVGDLCVRCTIDTYQACYDSLEQNAAMGSCENVNSLRDAEEFYGQCIPYLQTVACDVVVQEGWMLDSSCQGQLLR